MTTFLFKEFLFLFFKRSIPSGISITNRHRFILDGHGSHITLEAIEQAQKFGLDMIIIPLHTSHVFKPLNVTCFKPFNIAIKNIYIYITMVRRNYTKSNKIALARWVNKTLNLTFTRKNIMSGFKGTWFWPFNPRSLDSKTSPNILYTLQNQAREEKKSE
jgi:hypothetical protein